MAYINLLTGEGTSDLESDLGMGIDLLSNEIGSACRAPQTTETLEKGNDDKLPPGNGRDRAGVETNRPRRQLCGEARSSDIQVFAVGCKHEDAGTPNTAAYDKSASKDIRANAVWQLSENKPTAREIQEKTWHAERLSIRARNNHEATTLTRREDDKDFSSAESRPIDASKGSSTTESKNLEQTRIFPINVTREYYNLCLEYQHKFGDISHLSCWISSRLP